MEDQSEVRTVKKPKRSIIIAIAIILAVIAGLALWFWKEQREESVYLGGEVHRLQHNLDSVVTHQPPPSILPPTGAPAPAVAPDSVFVEYKGIPMGAAIVTIERIPFEKEAAPANPSKLRVSATNIFAKFEDVDKITYTRGKGVTVYGSEPDADTLLAVLKK